MNTAKYITSVGCRIESLGRKWYLCILVHFCDNLPMAGMVTMAVLLLPLQLVATILTVCITL